jgi:hypothetical protein
MLATKRPRKKRPNGVILWRGVSLLDGKTPIVCIAVGTRTKSSNRKTGAMVQTYILRADMFPMEAVSTCADGGICGGCIHRKQPNGRRTCYVNIGQGPTVVYKTFLAGGYPEVTPEVAAELVAGKFVRLGTYGDPAAVPVAVWQNLVSTAGGYTGYTHQWRSVKFSALGKLCQASCETAADVAKAHARGFSGTFRVLPVLSDVPAAALHCPASAERGKAVQCVECRACNGTQDVVIHAHGPAKRFYAGRRKAAA